MKCRQFKPCTKVGSSKQRRDQNKTSLASSATTKLDTIWKSNTTSLRKLDTQYRDKRQLQAFEHKCYRKPLRIHYSEHKTNDDQATEGKSFLPQLSPGEVCRFKQKNATAKPTPNSWPPKPPGSSMDQKGVPVAVVSPVRLPPGWQRSDAVSASSASMENV
ncbi:hypothetical protein ACOMHN_067260 [Nucella lapillus]